MCNRVTKDIIFKSFKRVLSASALFVYYSYNYKEVPYHSCICTAAAVRGSASFLLLRSVYLYQILKKLDVVV